MNIYIKTVIFIFIIGLILLLSGCFANKQTADLEQTIEDLQKQLAEKDQIISNLVSGTATTLQVKSETALAMGLWDKDNPNKPKTVSTTTTTTKYVEESTTTTKPAETTTSQVIEEATTTTVNETTTTKTDSATLGEKNALKKALTYLACMSFSYSGLVEQLKFEGFTQEEAVYGVDRCGADWNEQAALKARQYLDIFAFSRNELIAQLEYEGFTRQQAEYGAAAVGY